MTKWSRKKKNRSNRRKHQQSVRVHDIHSLEDARNLPPLPKGALAPFPILPEMLELGAFGGMSVSEAVLTHPDSYQGALLLSYNVSVSDPREVWEFPEVVEFTRGMVLSHPQVLDYFENRSGHQSSLISALLCTFPDIIFEDERARGGGLGLKAKALQVALEWLFTQKGSLESLPPDHREYLEKEHPHWLELAHQYSASEIIKRSGGHMTTQ